MKKRLRKKKRVGEFKVFGAAIVIVLREKSDYDAFLDSFLTEALEANGCFIGGAGLKNRFNGFIELGCRHDLPEQRLAAVSDWLKADPDVEKYDIGMFTDAWYGPFNEPEAVEDNTVVYGV